MSSPRKLTSALLLAALVFPISAHAGLYGFDEAHPYTPEEKLLSIDVPPHSIKNYRDLLRENVIALSNYAKANRPDFQIMVHEGQDLLTRSLWEYHLDGYLKARNNGEDVSDPSFLLNLKQTSPEFEPLVGGRSAEYLKSIDAVVVNNHFCQKFPLNPVIVQNGIKAFSVDLVVGVPDSDGKRTRRGQRDKLLNILNRLKPNLKFPHKNTPCNCTNLFFSCIIGGIDSATALTSPHHRWIIIIIAVSPEISTVGLDD